MIRFLLPALLLALTAALSPAPAHAWGALGHRLIARLAESQLTPQARDTIAQLLAQEDKTSLAAIATWADDIRRQDPGLGRVSAKWHFVNFHGRDCRYDAARDCPGGDCVVEAIQAQARILADRGLPPQERLQALKFVVHFVGDIHQPMHAGHAHDRGGNTVQVNYRGRGSNLHALWDGTLISSLGLTETGHYQRLSGMPPPADAVRLLEAADAPAWAEASCRIVQQSGVYPPRAKIGEDYIERHRPIAEQSLLLAGTRLAAVLNAALG